MQKRTYTILKKFILFSVILFLTILTVTSTAFVLMMEQNLIINTGDKLVQSIETEQTRLEASVNSEIAVILRMANSPVIKRHFAEPADKEFERLALEAFDTYREAFTDAMIFWMNDTDKIFYSSDSEPFVLDTSLAENYWYNLTIYETEIYNFNINYNPDLDVLNLWINAPVFDNGTPIGIVGCGINLSEFIDDLYEGYRGDAELYLFNRAGEVTGAKDIEYVASKIDIDEKLGLTGKSIFNKAMELESGTIESFELVDGSGVAALGKITALDWNIIAIRKFNFGDSLRDGMTVLFAIMMTIILIIIILFNIFAAKLLNEAESAKARAEAARETVMESINYASKIQKNLLPADSMLTDAFLDFSILWKPRDIVGGDIYWAKSFESGTVLCVCDCTGHGTPGALLTMLVASTLEATVNESNLNDTAYILFELDKRLASALHAESNEKLRRDIMDISDGCDLAILFVASNGDVTISNANMDVFICDGKTVEQLKGQKVFIGEGKIKSKELITFYHIPGTDENKFYIASDGLFGQIGGTNKRMFGYHKFKKLILDNHLKPQTEAVDLIWDTFEDYRGDEPRRDDVVLVALKPA